jgi:hypothetical protein
MIGFISSWVTHSTLKYGPYSAISVIHIFHCLQFTVANALGFWVSTSRFLATDLNTETITSNHWGTHSSYYTQTSSSNDTFRSSSTVRGCLPRRTHRELLRTSRGLLRSQIQSHIATDGRSVSKSWCRAPCGAHEQIFITLWHLRSCFCGAPSLTRGRVCLLYMLLALSSAVFLGSETQLLVSDLGLSFF